MEAIKYRVGVENMQEHIDCWDYAEDEYELAKAIYDSIELEEGQNKYILKLHLVFYRKDFLR